MKKYNEDSIQSLEPLEFTRLKPDIYCGNTAYNTQLIVEYHNNIIDEFVIGNGKDAYIEIFKDNHIEVRDEGQGFLVNIPSKKYSDCTVFEASLSKLNTSGKYKEDGTYEGTSLGAFGIGAKLGTFLSHWLEAVTYRNGEFEFLRFEDGKIVKKEFGKCDKSKKGTKISFLPDEQFFINNTPDLTRLRRMLKETACLCVGLRNHLIINDKEEIFESKKGISELVDINIGDSELLNKSNRMNIDVQEGKFKMNMCLTYTTNYNTTIIPYVNYGLTVGGTHVTAFKSTLTREINKIARAKGWLKEKDKNLEGTNIQEGLYVIFNLCAPNIKYDGQVKNTVESNDLGPFISKTVADGIKLWADQNPTQVKAIVDKALKASKVAAAAKKARDAARGAAPAKKKELLKGSTKLSDAKSTNRSECECFIVEGDSAGGGMKSARINRTQAILPVRGKILNTQKASLDKILANEEIRSMIDAFGLALDTKNGTVKVIKSQLRYSKIIVCTDADVDGAHIATLFYTFIFNFAPELIEWGYIYTSVPPLYRITTSKGYLYLKGEKELQEYRANNVGKKYEVSRNKGLGEMDPSELEETILNEKTRQIKKITMNDRNLADTWFEGLMGKKVDFRKTFMNTTNN